MIIDAHVHIDIDGHEDKSVPELLAAMDAAGIGHALVFAATINRLPTETVLAKIAPHRDRLSAVGTVSPILAAYRTPPEVVGGWLADGSIRALKFYTGYEHFHPDDPRLRPYMDLLVKHDRPAIFHMGDLYDKIPGAKLRYSQPLAVDDLASEMPDLKIVIAHLGYPWVIDAAEVCYKNANVYADCSGFVYGDFTLKQRDRFREAWATFDAVTESGGKILFGSDWPISHMPDYVELVGQLAGPQRERVFSGNAKRLFGL